MSNPAPAVARDSVYAGSGGFSFLYPFAVTLTTDGSLVGAGTYFPIGMTLVELVKFAFEVKTYRYQFPAYLSWGAEDRKLFRGFLTLGHAATVAADLDEGGLGVYPGSLFSGSGTDYDVYVTGHMGVQRKLNRAQDVQCGARWAWADEVFDVDCFLRDDVAAAETVCYFYGGSYYPKIRYNSTHVIGGTTIYASNGAGYANALSGGSVSVFGYALTVKASAAGLTIPTGISFSVGDVFDQGGA
jgi:hypothetical protein